MDKLTWTCGITAQTMDQIVEKAEAEWASFKGSKRCNAWPMQYDVTAEYISVGTVHSPPERRLVSYSGTVYRDVEFEGKP